MSTPEWVTEMKNLTDNIIKKEIHKIEISIGKIVKAEIENYKFFHPTTDEIKRIVKSK